ncbi:unnamed protein product [Rhizophagus irregularis]|uniref:Uncharacterized protein n=1 Tax=Rhizophagus irregularis TaxID=588596 RepID=A0A915YVT8_9GLOM|nr:unnamed protein product [Rhizophagus irregularis]
MQKIFRCYQNQRQPAVFQRHKVIKAHLQPSGALQSSDALSPSITIQPSDIRKSFGITIPHMSITKELETEIEIELTKEYSFMRDRNPIM